MYPNHPRHSPNAVCESAERTIRGGGGPAKSAVRTFSHDVEATLLAHAYVFEKLSEAERAVEDGLHGIGQSEEYFRIRQRAEQAEQAIAQLKKAELDGNERGKFEKVTSKYRELMSKVLGLSQDGYAVPAGV